MINDLDIIHIFFYICFKVNIYDNSTIGVSRGGGELW